MPNQRRRHFLATSAIACFSLASGCVALNQQPQEEPENSTVRNNASQNRTSLPDVPGTGAASFIVQRDGEDAVAVNGSSGREAFRSSNHGDVIQDTLDATPDGGGIHFQGPKFTVPREIAIRTDGIALTGNQATLSFQDHDPVDFDDDNPPKQRDIYFSSETGLEYVTIDGLIFQSNKDSRSNGSITLDIGNADRVSVTNCTVYGGREDNGNWGYGTVSGGERDEHVVIENCLFKGADRHAIHHGGRITNCTFENNALADQSGGVIGTAGFEKTIISHCHFVDNEGEAIRMNGGEDLVVTGNIFRNNVNSVNDAGQVNVSQYGFETVKISDNVFELTVSDGDRLAANVMIELGDAAGTVVVADNALIGGDWALLITNYSDERPLDRLIVDGNTMVSNRSVFRAEGAKTGVIRNNVMEGEEDSQIAVEHIDNSIFVDNTIVGTDFYVEEGGVVRDNTVR